VRPVQLGQPMKGQEIQWIINALYEIERASQEDRSEIADGYTVTNLTTNRVLNSGTATVAQVAQVLATFLQDTQKRGSYRAI
jgi:hypothetical protein